MLVPSKAYKDTVKEEDPQGNYGLSKPISFTRVILSSIRMNLKIALRYKADLFGGFIEIILLVGIMVLFAGALIFKGTSLESFTQDQTLIFYLATVLILSLGSIALWYPLQIVERDMTNGTIEILFFSPSSKYGYFFGAVLSHAILKFSLFFIPAFILMYFMSGASLASMAMVMLMTGVILVTFISMGIIIGLAGIIWKETAGIVTILGVLFQFLGGGFFPVQAFPEPLPNLSLLIPYTYAFDLIRFYTLEGVWTPLLPIEIEILIMLFYAGIYLMISVYLLKKVEKHAKNKGLHLI